jgi:peroxiredoxin
MTRRTAVRLAAAMLGLTLCGAALAEAPASRQAKIGQPVQDFKFKDLMQDEDAFYSLSQYKGKKNVVLVFVSYNCDVTWRYEKRIGKLLKDYGKKDVVFLGVRSSARDELDQMRKYAESKNLAFPVLYDAKNEMADFFGVQVTPTFVVIDKQGVMRYRGSYDDAPEETKVAKQFVTPALDAVLAGQPVKVAENRAFG